MDIQKQRNLILLIFCIFGGIHAENVTDINYEKGNSSAELGRLNRRCIEIMLTKKLKLDDAVQMDEKVQLHVEKYIEARERLEIHYEKRCKESAELNKDISKLKAKVDVLKSRLNEKDEKIDTYVRVLDRNMDEINNLTGKLRNTNQNFEIEKKTREKLEEKLREKEEIVTTLKDENIKFTAEYEFYKNQFMDLEFILKKQTSESFIDISLGRISKVINSWQQSFWTRVQEIRKLFQSKINTWKNKHVSTETRKSVQLRHEAEERFNQKISQIYENTQKEIRTLNEQISNLREEKYELQRDFELGQRKIEEFVLTIEEMKRTTSDSNIAISINTEETTEITHEIEIYEACIEIAEEQVGISKGPMEDIRSSLHVLEDYTHMPDESLDITITTGIVDDFMQENEKKSEKDEESEDYP